MDNCAEVYVGCHAMLLSHGQCAVLAAIGSGGGYALAAARALHDIDGYDAMQIGTA